MRYLSTLLLLPFFLIKVGAQPVLTLWISPDGYHNDHNHSEMQAYPCNSSYYLFYSIDPGVVPVTIKNEGDETLIIDNIATQTISGASLSISAPKPLEIPAGEMHSLDIQYQLPEIYVNGINGSVSFSSNDPTSGICTLHFDVGCSTDWKVLDQDTFGVKADFCDEYIVFPSNGNTYGIATPKFVGRDSQLFYVYDRSTNTSVLSMMVLNEGVIFPNALLAGVDPVSSQHVLTAGYTLFGNAEVKINGITDINGKVDVHGNLTVDSSVTVDGLLTVNGMFNQSDERIKRDISPLYQGLAKIMSLQPYSYFLRDTTIHTTRQYGFTAQDIEDVLPELVRTNSKDYKSVNYVQLIPWLTAALQEQQKEIEDLRQQLERQDELQNRILALEQKLDK